MNEQEILRNKALLSAAAYTDFFDKNGQKIDFDNADLHGALGKYSKFTLDDIKYFTTNFEVIHQQLETPRGFSAALIKDKRTGQLTLAIRGTQEPIDFVQDINLVNSGLAVDQLVDATNYLSKLMTPIGQKYQHLQVTYRMRGYQGIMLSSDKYLITVSRYEDGLGLISGNIDLSGHSLAHSIAISLSTIFKNIGTVSGFNGAGAMLSENSKILKKIASLSGQQFDLDRGVAKATNYVGEGPRIIAGTVAYSQNGHIVVLKTGSSAHGIRTILDYFEYRNLYTSKVGSVTVNNAFELMKNTDLNRKSIIDSGKDIAFSSNALSFVTDREALNADAKRDGSVANTLNTARYYAALDGFRVSNYNESADPLSAYLNKTGGGGTALQNVAIRVNSASGWASKRLPIDPLVIDLNGDGIKLTRYTDTPILFDIDNDGGSLEQTGWFSATDGVLVRDLNNNGKIDNIAEMFSEYYGGKAGSQDESGEKRYMNGFEALQ